ncbi:TIGR04211 family SH3 domain-containing protein [Gammaproteobacteria bacterium]|jgi:SH3 domain protein|nr:TIGR04211 family SH3 domain-containing protein [Gammaproteobacteria bacterium]
MMKLPFFLLFLLSSFVNAETYVYITDQVDIPMRGDPSIKSDNLMKRLESGTKLELISSKDGWTEVRYQGKIGWVISRYLTSNPSARSQLEKLMQDVNKDNIVLQDQKIRIKSLESEIKELKTQNSKIFMQGEKFKAEKEHVEQVYKDALKLEHENEKLRTESLNLKTEIQLLKNSSTIAQEATSRNWFIVGALVLLIGIIFGFIIQRMAKPRRF